MVDCRLCLITLSTAYLGTAVRYSSSHQKKKQKIQLNLHLLNLCGLPANRS